VTKFSKQLASYHQFPIFNCLVKTLLTLLWCIMLLMKILSGKKVSAGKEPSTEKCTSTDDIDVKK